jgi:uncharacterized protein YkwD
LLAAAAASSSPAAAAADCAHAGAPPAQLSTPEARHTLQCLVNRVRREHGLQPVRPEGRLAQAALSHSADMTRHRYFGHERPGGGDGLGARVRRTGYLDGARRWWIGEALAWGRGRAGTPSSILQALLASPPHRAILLDPSFRDMGVGLVHGAPSGRGAGALTITLDFGRRGR